jgi:hypothetical protein
MIYYMRADAAADWGDIVVNARGDMKYSVLKMKGKELRKKRTCTSCNAMYRMGQELGHMRCKRDFALYPFYTDLRPCAHWDTSRIEYDYEVTLLHYFLRYLTLPSSGTIKSVLLVPAGNTGYPDLSKSIVKLRMV